jgi:hypothetical protein
VFAKARPQWCFWPRQRLAASSPTICCAPNSSTIT